MLVASTGIKQAFDFVPPVKVAECLRCRCFQETIFRSVFREGLSVSAEDVCPSLLASAKYPLFDASAVVVLSLGDQNWSCGGRESLATLRHGRSMLSKTIAVG